MNIKPIRRKLLVRRCTSAERIVEGGKVWYVQDGITVPQLSGDYSRFAEIIAVAADCRMFSDENIGQFVYLPEYSPNHMTRVPSDDPKEASEDFIVREELFEKLTYAAVFT